MRKSEYSNVCYGCRCNTCAFSVENRAVNVDTIKKLRKAGIKWNACFSCDQCRNYDGDSNKGDCFTQTCPEYIIDDFHAWKNREQFKIINGIGEKRC